MRKILAISSIRSDYDLMSELYRLLDLDEEVDLRLLVSGAHLSPAHGYTVANIRNDGLNILAEIETLISTDSASARLKTASVLLISSIDIVKQFEPDVIVYAGDREDVLVGGMLGGFLGIPTAHFFGGDHATDGHIDNSIRHATTKLSSVHFVSIQEHKNRLLSMGEAENRIFVIGSVALDKFIREPILGVRAVLNKMEAKAHAYSAPLAILIFHPIADEIEVAAEYIRNSAQALIDNGFHVCIGAPNTDPGNYRINQELEHLSKRNEVTVYRNLARAEFINLFRNSKIIVGNSSSGLLEAASLKLPAINIGQRQHGRTCGSNVIFSEGSYASVFAAIQICLSASFQNGLMVLSNPYGDGNSSRIAAGLLKTIKFPELLCKTDDPLYMNLPILAVRNE